MMENKTKIDLKNKSVFITGVAGFIGSNLARRLLSTVEGVKVVGLDNMNHYYDVRLKEARLNELVHLNAPQLGIISWDLTVDQNGVFVLIEANTRGQSIWFPQMANGMGAFGKNTAEILKFIAQK